MKTIDEELYELRRSVQEHDVSEMVGHEVVSVAGCEKGSARIVFTCKDGARFVLYHYQDCCETVEVEDVCGDVADLIGSPLVLSEAVSNKDDPPPASSGSPDSYTWTFYRFATARGLVTIRWFGRSNGYYSERVDFVRLEGAA